MTRWIAIIFVMVIAGTLLPGCASGLLPFSGPTERPSQTPSPGFVPLPTSTFTPTATLIPEATLSSGAVGWKLAEAQSRHLYPGKGTPAPFLEVINGSAMLLDNMLTIVVFFKDIPESVAVDRNQGDPAYISWAVEINRQLRAELYCGIYPMPGAPTSKECQLTANPLSWTHLDRCDNSAAPPSYPFCFGLSQQSIGSILFAEFNHLNNSLRIVVKHPELDDIRSLWVITDSSGYGGAPWSFAPAESVFVVPSSTPQATPGGIHITGGKIEPVDAGTARITFDYSIADAGNLSNISFRALPAGETCDIRLLRYSLYSPTVASGTASVDISQGAPGTCIADRFTVTVWLKTYSWQEIYSIDLPGSISLSVK